MIRKFSKCNESKIDKLAEEKEEKWYFCDFLKALFQIKRGYIDYHYDDHDNGPRFVERVSAYELYHQFRKIMDENKKDYKGVYLNGEPRKEGKFYKKLSSKFSSCYPDLVLHKSPKEVDPDGQYLLCEMKTIENFDIIKDLEKLKKLEDCELHFKYYIFLLVNGGLSEIKAKIQGANNENKDIFSLFSKNTVCVSLLKEKIEEEIKIEYCRLGEIIENLKE